MFSLSILIALEIQLGVVSVVLEQKQFQALSM